MKELIKIMFPAKEWGEVEERWAGGDLRVVAWPIALAVACIVGMWLGS